VRRNQFTEVTGPGGIEGNPSPATDPIWATGWDTKSVVLALREPDTGWSCHRLPKAAHSYDGALVVCASAGAYEEAFNGRNRLEIRGPPGEIGAVPADSQRGAIRLPVAALAKTGVGPCP